MERSVAKVAVEVPLANLDHAFDYAVPAALADQAQPGVRVKVRFAGRLRDGYVLARTEPDQRSGLAELVKVVSPEPVLAPAVARLVRDVADHYAGSFADVVRTAVPPRHAATEKAVTSPRPAPLLDSSPGGLLRGYPGGDRLLDAWGAQGKLRAAWTVAPTPSALGDWAAGFAEAAAAVLADGRGALLLVPDAVQLERLEAACTARFGAGSFAVLSADAGPSARYRNFLAVARSQVKLVLGTRAAVFAPVAELGLIALWDDGNDSYAEPHAPYWHAREVAALRAHREGCSLLIAAHNRTAEVQQLVARGWLAALELKPTHTRAESAAVRPMAISSARDPLAEVTRLPREAFEVVRGGLVAGPVLIQVPRAGYFPLLVCAQCREPARCLRCQQPLSDGGTGPTCRWCGPPLTAWSCSRCGSSRLRSPVIGVSRTAEELGKAFPGVNVVQSSAEKRVRAVGDKPALVLATPGAAPQAVGGYAAAVLLDAELMLGRADLRAGEESLRRWLAIVAMVRPAAAGGTVLVVGQPALREVQALVRLDPVGYAEGELAQRAEAEFPPAVKMVMIEGSLEALSAVKEAVELPGSGSALGPFEINGDEQNHRLTLRASLAEGGNLVAAVKAVVAVRAARKDAPVRVRVDAQVMD
jgi:primosomal protein N' (replication factor Y) (superfamily II helicase)